MGIVELSFGWILSFLILINCWWDKILKSWGSWNHSKFSSTFIPLSLLGDFYYSGQLFDCSLWLFWDLVKSNWIIEREVFPSSLPLKCLCERLCMDVDDWFLFNALEKILPFYDLRAILNLGRFVLALLLKSQNFGRSNSHLKSTLNSGCIDW